MKIVIDEIQGFNHKNARSLTTIAFICRVHAVVDSVADFGGIYAGPVTASELVGTTSDRF